MIVVSDDDEIVTDPLISEGMGYGYQLIAFNSQSIPIEDRNANMQHITRAFHKKPSHLFCFEFFFSRIICRWYLEPSWNGFTIELSLF